MTQTSKQSSSATASRRPSVITLLLKYGVPLIVSIGLCYTLFSGVDIHEMMETIRTKCDYRWIALGMALSIFSHIFRAMRWRIQLNAMGIRVPLFTLVLSIFGTYAVNLILPRLGELWRTGYIAKRQEVPFDKVFGSMIADRLSDTITVGLLTLFTFIFAGGAIADYLSQNEQLYDTLTGIVASPLFWIAIVASIIALTLIIRAMRHTAFAAKVAEFGRGIWKGFAVIATMPGKGRWLLLTVCLWGCYFVQLYVCFFAFPETAEVLRHYGIQAVLVCFVLSSISMAVPSNGGIGPWQYAVIFGLSLYQAGVPGITTEISTAFANLVMGSTTLLLIVLGLFTFICIAIDRRRDTPLRK